MLKLRFLFHGLLLFLSASPAPLFAQLGQEPTKASPTPVAPPIQDSKRPPRESAEQLDLPKAIEGAANDRAALVKNLEAFLEKYPQTLQRPQIYRALVEAGLQLRDFSRAKDYSERLVSLNPEDMSNTVLSIQLLDRYGDIPGYRRAVFYCSRVIESVDRASPTDKSPRLSPEEWHTSKKRDKSSLLLLRGGLYRKLNDFPNAQKDFEASYALIPNAAAAERLGEMAELNKNFPEAIREYARAFALTDGTGGYPARAALRKKIGNVWRLAHGSEDGLGEYLLHAFDDTQSSLIPAKVPRNHESKDPYEFVLRKVEDGAPVKLADFKGKVLVLNFWASWCGPCRELEPSFERVAARYYGRKDVIFYSLNCDDDESLVLPVLKDEKPNTPALFADGLDSLLNVNAFPTTVILGSNGKIAFREDGFSPEMFEKSLTAAIELALHPSDKPAPTADPAR